MQIQKRFLPAVLERPQMHFANGHGMLGTVRTD